MAYIQTKEFGDLHRIVRVNEMDQQANGTAIFVWIHGPTGSGKSQLVKEYAKHRGRELVSLSLNSSTSVEELLGYCQASNGSTEFKDGLLTEAVRFGKWLLLEEFDTADASLMTALHQLADYNGGIRTLGNEWIKRHPKFALFVTANSHGFGDESGQYIGVARQNHALLNRFDFLYMPYMSPDDEQKVVESFELCTPETAKKTVEFLNSVRASHKAGELSGIISLRQIYRFLAYIRFDMEAGLSDIPEGLSKKATQAWILSKKTSATSRAIDTLFPVLTDQTKVLRLAHAVYGLDTQVMDSIIAEKEVM